ncbi:MAG: ATP-binding protein [Gemmataceae bacterium]
MGDGKDGGLLKRLTPRSAAWVAIGLALLLVLADALTPADYLIPILYAAPLVLSIWIDDARFVWGMAFGLTAVSLLLFVLGPAPSHPEAWQPALVNRVFAAFMLFVVAGFAYARSLSTGELEARRRALEQQNVALEAANQELSDREEEIVRQNEELQAQTEELERQSEELRITNEELASREKTLEQLLELSRTLTADLPRDEMLKRICEALEVLTDGMASAILQREGSDLLIPCHHGFGPEGLQSESLPYAQSFASLIMSLGKTGFLEDTSLRPDVKIPEPRSGEAIRSVLSSPLRVRGQCVGTIEIYATEVQSWSQAQIGMLESLAAQASISLQSAELVEGIRLERRRFEAAFHTVPFGMAVADDPQAQSVRLNPAAAAMFNVPVNDNVGASTPIGARLQRCLFRNDRPLPEEDMPLRRALRGEEIQAEELHVVLPRGKQMALLVSAAPTYDSKNQIAGAVCAFADITAHKNLQRELELRRREAEEANVRKTRFLASVSHDIRTPVNAINLIAEVLRRTAGSPAMVEQIPEMTQKLQANARSLVELVSDVLDIARFDSGKVELQESEFLLSDLINDEYRQALPLAEDKGIELFVKLPERPVWLRTDRIKLGRALGNLIGNAIKFTDRGRVQLSADIDQERRLCLRVSDTGIGIASSHIGRIFDEFTQVHNPERDRSKGTGLGLAICKRLVDVMGGTLSVESAPDQGSTFTLALPASLIALRLDPALVIKDPKRISEAAAGRTGRLKGMRILLVEDHEATRQSTAHILRSEGAVVVEASDGRSGLELVQNEQGVVLLLDMMLPDMDGREILTAIQNNHPPGLKAVLVLTGDMTKERLDEAQQLGADALIGKPVDIDQLLATLRDVAGGSFVD